MNKPKYYITCYKAKATDTIGYLFLQSKGRQNRKKKALGISVNYDKFKTTWNEKEQRFKSGMENYKILNERIANSIADFTKEDGELKPVVKVNNQSFLKFWDRQIELIPNQGSKGKHIVVKTKLEKYIKSISRNDISFSDMTPNFIKDVHYYFKTAKDPERLTTNSVTNYMKLINNIIRRKIKEDPYSFNVNPFASITYDKKESTDRTVLNEKEVNRLLTTKIDDPNLDFIRDLFVFQIFASGMRVSDLCLLRWRNVNHDFTYDINFTDLPEPTLQYVMFKTRAEQETPFTIYLCKSILKMVNDTQTFDLRMGNEYLRIFVDSKEYSYKDIEPELNNHYFSSETNTVPYNGFFINKTNNEHIKAIIDAYLQAKNNSINHLIQDTAYSIKKHYEKYKCENNFVFPILNSNDFKELPENDKMFKDVVSKSEELKGKLEYGKKQYRIQLDKVCKLCGIKKATPHTARHTFTQLMINAGATTHNIMNELGHTTLNVTDSYVRHKKFKNKYGENFVEKIGNKLR